MATSVSSRNPADDTPYLVIQDLPPNETLKSPKEKDRGFLRSSSGIFRRRTHLSRDGRRDSGLASSVSTAGDRSETAETRASVINEHTPRAAVPVVPSIVIRHDTTELPSSTQHESDPSNTMTAVFSQRDGQVSTSPTNGQPFITITTDIPTGDFEDPFPSQIQFSNRGSVLLGPAEADAFERATQRNASGVLMPEQLGAITLEDQRLSRQVRSLYEPAKKLATDHASVHHTESKSNAVVEEEADLVPEMANVSSAQQRSTDDRSRESSSITTCSIRRTQYQEHRDAAGGIEDWTDVDSRDVDRWGFIKPRSLSSKRSSVVSMSAPGSPDPYRTTRPGTALAVVEERRSGLQSGSARKRTNRLSLNPGSKGLRSSPSLLSSRSKRSTTSKIIPHRMSNGGPRWLWDAPQMLMPSPGLGSETVDPYLDPNREAKRADKWQKMAKPIVNSRSVRGAGAKYFFNTSDPKLISRVWKGIPDRWRSQAWDAFLTSSATRSSATKRPEPSDEELEAFFHRSQDDDCVDDVQIDMDVPRTIGNHLQFRKRYQGGQRFLFRVLRALSLYFPATGYVQGMASVVATLLVYYEESRAFVMAVRMWELRGIRKLYAEGFEGLMGALQELEERWITRTEVLKQLEDLGISTSAWGPKWYLTLFNYVLPFHTMLRVWDVFMLLGDPPFLSDVASASDKTEQANFDILHAASAAMLFALRETIVGADFENAMKALTSPVVVGKDDKMMEIARRLWEDTKGKR